MLALLESMRPYQWVKNLLVFAPLIAAHRAGEPGLLGASALAFAAFSLAASAVYVVNDLVDVEADRAHPRKRARPFASGRLSVGAGIVAALALLAGAAGIGALLPRAFLGALATYVAIAIAYSLRLKALVIVDVCTLTTLYTLRVIAGFLATRVAWSSWLFLFALFLFFSLAFLKRYAELRELREVDGTAAAGRGYVAGDLELIATLGASAGQISVLVLALYVNSAAVTALYRLPEALWLLCLLVLYWVSRAWLLAHRRLIDDDPIVFAIRDPASYTVAAGAAAVIALATFGPGGAP